MSPPSSRVFLCANFGNGHINPLMVLAEKLALLGMPVTVVFPEKASFDKIHSGTVGDLDIEFELLETGRNEERSLPVTPVKRARPHRPIRDMVWPDSSAQQVKFEKLLQEKIASGCKPAAVVHDYLVLWASGPARQLGISTYAMVMSSAINLAVTLHMRRLSSLGKDVQVPGLPAIPTDDIWFTSESIFDSSHPLYQPRKLWEEQLGVTQGVLINSSALIEGKAIEALRHLGKPFADKLIPVGPLVPSYYVQSSNRTSSATTVIPSKEEELCSEWLSQQPDRSVIYVSFGSWAILHDEQITELAAGLEATKLRFLWVLPLAGVADPDNYLRNVLPPGFLEETSTRGLIVRGYAPQHLILSHPAVAAFVTHCGWNSTLECIALAGVPMVTWPFAADQPINSRLLVEEVKIAVEAVDKFDGIVERDEVERLVKLVMHGDEADTLRKNAAELKKRVRISVENGVSELSEFAELLKAER